MAWAPSYLTNLELRNYLDDPEPYEETSMATAIAAASRLVDDACNRQFGVVDSAESRTFDTTWNNKRGVYVARIDDLSSLTGFGVTVSGSSLSSGQFALEPSNAIVKGRPYSRLVTTAATPAALGHDGDTITVTGLWGWSAVPDVVKEATALQAARLIRRPEAPFGVAGSPEMGSEVRLLAKLDPDAYALVRTLDRDRHTVFAF